jgi:hypothetical protein
MQINLLPLSRSDINYNISISDCLNSGFINLKALHLDFQCKSDRVVIMSIKLIIILITIVFNSNFIIIISITIVSIQKYKLMDVNKKIT